ncbi:MAG: hypothetical protein CM15mL4_3070 [uncultured marine virus]|nr:MAG: hypothetical protein CM15mL4_3070 [uncultured marine virus]
MFINIIENMVFPYYQIREMKTSTLRKLQKFDVDTIFKDNQIIKDDA